MAEQKSDKKLVTVTVKVPKREGFNGYWSGQLFWPEGNSTKEVTEEQLKELKADDAAGRLMLQEGGGSSSSTQNADQANAQAATGQTQSTQATEETASVESRKFKGR